MVSKNYWERIIRAITKTNVSSYISEEKIRKTWEEIFKVLRWKKIIKNVIDPLENLISFIDQLMIISDSFVRIGVYSRNWNNDQFISELRSICKILSLDYDRVKEKISKYLIDGNQEEQSVRKFVELIVDLLGKSDQNIDNNVFKRYRNSFLDMLLSESDYITFWTTIHWEDWDIIPSLHYFLSYIKMELLNYLNNVKFISIFGDSSILQKVEFWHWLKAQDRSWYIDLPYFHKIAEQILDNWNEWKVWQVVLKWLPWVWKTRIFEYIGKKLGRSIRIISMHQYINFYELMVQVRSKETPNNIGFIDYILKEFENKDSKQVVDEFKQLFELNKSSFPNDFSFIDFINSIFNLSLYSTSRLEFDLKDSDDDKIKNFIINSIKLIKSEQIFNHLTDKNKTIKWVMLKAIENWEIPVLDEIDKINEKDIEWLLAFLSFNVWRSYKIQWIDMFIPEWFKVYATSNDEHKPSWPLGARFNSIRVNYLDKKNIMMYIITKITSYNLDTPFNKQEISQIVEAVDLISRFIDRISEYNLLDFSLRMIDNFLNWFVTFSSGKPEKKLKLWSEATYILEALKNVFEKQTEDIYWKWAGSSIDVSEIWQQKTAVINTIQQVINSKRLFWKGWRIAKTPKAKINSLIARMRIDDPILCPIVDKKPQLECNIGWWCVSFSEQIARILSEADGFISRLKLNESYFHEFDLKKSFNIWFWGLTLDYNLEDKKIYICWDDWIKEQYECSRILISKNGNKLTINQWNMGYLVLEINDNRVIKKFVSSENVTDVLMTAWDLLYISKNSNNLIVKAHSNSKEFSYFWNCKYKISSNWLFLIIFDEKSINVVPIMDGDVMKWLTISYKNKLKSMSNLLMLNNMNLTLELWDEIVDCKFDSSYEYLFITIRNWDLFRNEIFKIK